MVVFYVTLGLIAAAACCLPYAITKHQDDIINSERLHWDEENLKMKTWDETKNLK